MKNRLRPHLDCDGLESLLYEVPQDILLTIGSFPCYHQIKEKQRLYRGLPHPFLFVQNSECEGAKNYGFNQKKLRRLREVEKVEAAASDFEGGCCQSSCGSLKLTKPSQPNSTSSDLTKKNVLRPFPFHFFLTFAPNFAKPSIWLEIELLR